MARVCTLRKSLTVYDDVEAKQNREIGRKKKEEEDEKAEGRERERVTASSSVK